MDIRSLNLIFWLTFFCVFPVEGKRIEKNLANITTISPLRSIEGYLVVYVNASGVGPSIEFSRVKTKKLDVITTEPYLKFTQKYTLHLNGLDKGLYYLPMPEGVYQITKVNAPFYDLPYWLPTENTPQWRFSIHRDKFNFIGELNIAKERSSGTIDVNLYNRIATYQEQLKSELNKVQVPYTLITTSGYRDDFFQELEK